MLTLPLECTRVSFICSVQWLLWDGYCMDIYGYTSAFYQIHKHGQQEIYELGLDLQKPNKISLYLQAHTYYSVTYTNLLNKAVPAEEGDYFHLLLSIPLNSAAEILGLGLFQNKYFWKCKSAVYPPVLSGFSHEPPHHYSIQY